MIKIENNKYKNVIEILGLPMEFSFNELKKNYRKKIKENHPDKSNYDNHKIQEFKESYELLKEYFLNYKISFKDEEIKLSPDEFLKRKIMDEWKV